MEETFWLRFLEAVTPKLRRGVRPGERPDATLTPGNTAEECEAFLASVTSGRRTAVIRTLEEFRLEGRDLPRFGSYELLLRPDGEPCCVLRMTGTSLIPFRELPDRLIDMEGTGLTPKGRRDQLREQLFREAKAQGVPFSLDTLLVAETFVCAYWED